MKEVLAMNDEKVNNTSAPDEATVQAAEKIVAGALKKNGKNTLRGVKGFFKGLLVGVIAGMIVMSLFAKFTRTTLFGKVNEGKETLDHVINHTLFGYTAADYSEAVLGEATEHQELVVMEQPLDVTTTITKAGLGNLEIFSKTKTMTYFGKGVYTVNLSGLRVEDITVDNTNKTVTVAIPHAALQYVIPELEKTQFEDTERGLLAFGDIKLTAEETNEVETSVYNSMRERLEHHEMYEEADLFAQMKAWDIFQPLVSEVSPEYKLLVVFKS